MSPSLPSYTTLLVQLFFCAVLITKIPQSSTAFIAEGKANHPQGSNNSNTTIHSKRPTTFTTTVSSYSMDDSKEQNGSLIIKPEVGKLEELKEREAALSRLLAEVRVEKLKVLRSRPLTIGVVGFGRFGQFIAETFTKHGKVVATSRSDYTELASGMNVKYITLNDIESFLDENLDVIVLATSIVSFEGTVEKIATQLHKHIEKTGSSRGPLIVDVLSVKEFPRNILLDKLPKECDILCTHPMFGPDSGKNGWNGLNFVYERTRIDGSVLDPSYQGSGKFHPSQEDSLSHIEGVDRMERFLSIWEEEGCKMVPLTCKDHDSHAANSQFITHLMGRILGAQGLEPTPIDTRGFESVMQLIETTNADSFDLFYGLYKYNKNSLDTIKNLQNSMDDVVQKLKVMEEEDQ